MKKDFKIVFIRKKKNKNINEGVRKIIDIDNYRNELNNILDFISKDLYKILERDTSTKVLTTINKNYSFNLNLKINNNEIINFLNIAIVDSVLSDNWYGNDLFFKNTVQIINNNLCILISFNHTINYVENKLRKIIVNKISDEYFQKTIKDKPTIKDTDLTNYNYNRFNAATASAVELIECILYSLKRSTLNSLDTQIIMYLDNYLYGREHEILRVSSSHIKDIFRNMKYDDIKFYKILYHYPIQAIDKLAEITNVVEQKAIMKVFSDVYTNIDNTTYDNMLNWLKNKIERNKGRIEEHIRRMLNLKN